MIPWTLALALLLIAVVGSSAMVMILSSIYGRLRELERGATLNPGSGGDAGLREEVAALTDEVARLTERLDFTEKLLAAPKTDAGDPESV